MDFNLSDEHQMIHDYGGARLGVTEMALLIEGFAGQGLPRSY